jgi:phenylalanyl-tRNA synthetase beta chain
MRFSYNWLKSFVDINIDAYKLADKLSLAGCEVEALEAVGQNLQHIITGRIDKIAKHPNADKLTVLQVFDGQKTLQIVTGAQNIYEGAIVPVSIPGAVLANGIEIKACQLRGVHSEGMLCSEVELGFSANAQGIWLLPEDTPLGADLIKLAELKDYILDIAILPNRGDLQSIYGMAREISAVLNTSLKPIKYELTEHAQIARLDIKLAAPELCPYYAARHIFDAQNKPTPILMQKRLQISGIRPLGLFIDITNYVLLEFGQPLHAFDFDLLKTNSMVVRSARNKEKFTTLDNLTYELDKNTLLIATENKAIALAGIMGGKDSEINPDTKNILLEAAFFHPGAIRKTQAKLGLRTESSMRFDKGIDIEKIEFCSNYAASLYEKLAKAKVSKVFYKQKDLSYEMFQDKHIKFNEVKINQLLGTKYKRQDMLSALAKLGFIFDKKQQIMHIPSWRKHDIKEYPCLAEEIARLLGYDGIESRLVLKQVMMAAPTLENTLINKIKDFFMHNGFLEVNTFPMTSKTELEDLDKLKKERLELRNPLNAQEAIMRQDMLSSLLKVASYNAKRNMTDVRIFEIGKIFWEEAQTMKEEWQLGCLIMGDIFEHMYTQGKDFNQIDLAYGRGLMENLCTCLQIDKITFQTCKNDTLHPLKSLNIVSNKEVIGYFGMLHPKLLKKYRLGQDAGYFCLKIPKLKPKKANKYQPISNQPATRRDIAFLAPNSLSFASIKEVIEKYKPKKVQEYFLFDLFEDIKLGKDNKSLAMAFIYQDMEQTLSDNEVNAMHSKFCTFLAKQLPITIR